MMAANTSSRAVESYPYFIYPIYGICPIVPPYMLREILARGTPSQQKWAGQTLYLSKQFRERRELASHFPTRRPKGEKHRLIYDAFHSGELPIVPVREEGDRPSSDSAVNEAYDGLGYTYDFYYREYQRHSIDDRGMHLRATVHYDANYENAFWDGSQMVFGDGGDIFQRFTKAIDVIAHELTHGIVQNESGLVYWEEPGALNESLCDVFGSLVKQWVFQKTADEADWIIGANLFQPSVKGIGIRSLKAPGTAYDDPLLLGNDPQPSHMRDFYWNDEGDEVHINSGIPNHAFYLAAMEIGGYAWQKAGKIWYLALRDKLRPKSNFRQAAEFTLAIAAEIYGENSRECKAVRYGWETVGVL